MSVIPKVKPDICDHIEIMEWEKAVFQSGGEVFQNMKFPAPTNDVH